jgi:hypothetical protein
VAGPGQWGIGGPLEPRPARPFDVTATDFLQLARTLEEPGLGG